MTDGPITGLAYSPNGRYIAFASDDGVVRIRETATGAETVTEHVGAGGGVVFSHDGELVLVHGSSGPAELLEVASGERRCVFEEGGRAPADATLADGKAYVVKNGKAGSSSTRPAVSESERSRTLVPRR